MTNGFLQLESTIHSSTPNLKKHLSFILEESINSTKFITIENTCTYYSVEQNDFHLIIVTFALSL
jgi:hypothetical protein